MKQQQILPAVAAAIFNHKGEVLLQKRSDVNKWCIISGHVEFGETVEHAILREIKEETNTAATITRLIGVYSSPQSQTYEYTNKTVQYVTSYFEVQLSNEPDPGYSNNETRELRFFPPAELPSDMALINHHWLSDALDRNNSVFIR
jgi:8-oxo-dGTP diphosphatase